MRLLHAVGSFLQKQSYTRQMHQGPPSPSLWGLKSNTKGELCVQNVSTVNLAKTYGTPLLVVDAQNLRKHVQSVQGILQQCFTSSRIAYSYKTNCIPGIVKILHDLGVGAEVISGYEYWLAQSLGVPGEHIVYNGVDKSACGIASAVAAGSLINIDNCEEVHTIIAEAQKQQKQARVGIRLGMSLDTQLGVFMDSEDMEKILHLIFSHGPELNLCALHFNTQSNAKNSSYHVKCTLKALQFMKMLQEKYHTHISILDIGGGMGVPTSKNMNSKEYGIYRLFGVLPVSAHTELYQPLAEYFSDIGTCLKEFCRKKHLEEPTIIIEPGRMLTSQYELMLSSVLAIKNPPGKDTYAITDAGRLSHAYPCDFELHEALLANDVHRPLAQSYTVTGRVCTRSDWLYRGKILPKLVPQDILAILDAGAYFSSYAMNFAFARAAIVVVDGEDVRVLRRRESFKYLVAMDNVDFIHIPEE